MTTKTLTHQDLKKFIIDVPDFPKPGIIFKDITPLLADPAAFAQTIEMLAQRLTDTHTDEILAIESRGFIFGAAVANHLSLPLHLVRKEGKLPRETIGIDYALEYGTDRVELHHDTLSTDRRYAIVDDVIATGGTAAATVELVRKQGAELTCCAFVIELGFLHGRDLLDGCRIESLIEYS
jgi:adenine phosphoribosyltransferase